MSATHTPPSALLLMRLWVENASIISSHLTYGMPSPTAFVGFGHALQRKLNALAEYQTAQVVGVGVVCHAFHPQITQTKPYAPYQLNLTRHPVESDGGSAPLLEEGKGHFEVTLIFGLAGAAIDTVMSERVALAEGAVSAEKTHFINQCKKLAWNMRLAGGSVFPPPRFAQPRLVGWSGDVAAVQKLQKNLYVRLLPGFVLRDQSHILPIHQAWLAEQPCYMATQGHAPTLLDALLDLSRLNWQAEAAEVPQAALDQGQDDFDPTESATDTVTAATSKAAKWRVRPRPAHQKGWLVPLPVGYGALTPVQAAGTVTGCRDDVCPAVFAETLLGVGAWVSPHRVKNLAEILWAYDAQPENGLYRVIQPFCTDVPALNSVVSIASTDALFADVY